MSVARRRIALPRVVAAALVSGVLAVSLGVPARVGADVPFDIHIQGRLLDPGGVPVTGPVTIQLSVYGQLAGGSPLLIENEGLVTLTDGVFSVILGDGSVIPSNLFASPNTYLEIVVDGEILQPRVPFQSSAYAIEAQNAVTVQGLTATELRTTSFTDLTDQIADAQIPALIARDTEIPTQLSQLSGQVSDAQIPATIARDSEVPVFLSQLAGQVSNAQIPSTIARDSEIPTLLSQLGGQVSDAQIPSTIARDTEVILDSPFTDQTLSRDLTMTNGDLAMTAGDVFLGTNGDVRYLTPRLVNRGLPASIFRVDPASRDGENAINYNSFYLFIETDILINNDTSAGFYAPLDLPSAVTIDELRCYYYDNSIQLGIGALDAVLRRRSYTTTSLTNMASLSTSTSNQATSTLVQSVFDDTISAASVDNGAYQYEIQITWNITNVPPSNTEDDDVRFYGCRVTYFVDELRH